MEIEIILTNKNGIIYKEIRDFQDGDEFFYLEDDSMNNDVIIRLDGEEYKFNLNLLIETIEQENEDLTLQTIKKMLNDDKDKIITRDYKFIYLNNFFDITDEDFANLSRRDGETIKNEGLWLGYGIRKLELNFEENSFLDDNVNIKLVINKKDNEEIEKIVFDVIKENNRFYILFDTNRFLDYFEDKYEHLFIGYITISKEIKNEMFVFEIPFRINIVNPIKPEIHEEGNQISIDFGTSSTCIAKDRGRSLIAFTDSPKNIKDYENVSALIFYNWQEIYKEWSNLEKPPYLKKSKEKNSLDIKLDRDYLDYGEIVKHQIETDPDTKTIEAIATLLKNIPVKLEKDRNNKDYIIPFDTFKDKVCLTDERDEENEETINPIALYGYIIGRLVNLQIRNKVYTSYIMTVPVTFNNYQRKHLKESLAYGLSRSIPETLQNKFELQIAYEEPIALLGAAHRARILNINEKPELFAVFDFGGGTLDFSFGIYRKSSNDEDIMVIEKENIRYRNVIELLKTDGMRLGGEILIELLAYELYKHNKDIMEEKNIPIFVPEKAEQIPNYPAKLLSRSHVAKVNLKSFSQIARRFFIGEVEKSAVEPELNLFSLNNTNITEPIKIKFSEDDISTFIKIKMEEVVKNFKNILIQVFTEYSDRLKVLGFDDFDIQDVKIILAGNTSKSKYLQEILDNEKLEYELLELEMKNINISMKTAVAQGALMLNNVYIKNYEQKSLDVSPFIYYIWNTDDLNDFSLDLEAVFKKGDKQSEEWKYVGRRDRDKFVIYYSDVSIIEDLDDINLTATTISIPKDKYNSEDDFLVYAKVIGDSRMELLVTSSSGNIDETNKFKIDIKSN